MDKEFPEMEKVLLKITGGAFPFSNIIKISVLQAKEIFAPSYILFPNTTEAEQIGNAKKSYGFN